MHAQPRPFRRYRTYVFDTDELIVRVLLERDVSLEDLRSSLEADWLPCERVEWVDDPADLSAGEFEDELPEPGVMRVACEGRWLGLYLNLGMMGPIDEELEMLYEALEKLHARLPIVEVVEVHGELNGELDDEWTMWSLQQQAPTAPPTQLRLASPYERDD